LNLGIIQGRLSQPVNGHIQEFPNDWRREFELLQECGLSHIEWLITKGSVETNPAFNVDISLSELPISSLCADTLVDKRIVDIEYLREHLTPICESAVRNAISTITIPLLEESSVENSDIRREFKGNIVEFTKNFPNLKFSFECELPTEELCDILELSDKFYVTYDTGNITSYGLRHEEYIDAIYERINNVHLKDRTYDAKTVYPSSGDTDFKAIFRNLTSLGYEGPYTMQTARGSTGNEINTILEHKQVLQGLYNAK
jgi:L-ribulose-5-phosphate 3-epimerase